MPPPPPPEHDFCTLSSMFKHIIRSHDYHTKVGISFEILIYFSK